MYFLCEAGFVDTLLVSLIFLEFVCGQCCIGDHRISFSFPLKLIANTLFQMDGFEQDKRIVVIAATNRKQDLDPALLR